MHHKRQPWKGKKEAGAAEERQRFDSFISFLPWTVPPFLAWAKSFTITVSCYFECVYLMTSHFLSSHTKVENDSAREKKEGKELTVKVGKKRATKQWTNRVCIQKRRIKKGACKMQAKHVKMHSKKCRKFEKSNLLKTYFSCTHILIENSL